MNIDFIDTQGMVNVDFSNSLLQYGDGFFETMLATSQQIINFSYHRVRWQHSCQRLQIPIIDFDAFQQSVIKALQQQVGEYFVVKVLIARGKSLRGYRTAVEQAPLIQVSLTPYQFNQQLYNTGQSVRICQTRLAQQALLAGLKHCNRLEQVLARREADDTNYYEGIMLDTQGYVIEGIVSNLFIIKSGELITPDLSLSGVAGTLRAQLLDYLTKNNTPVQVGPLTLADLAEADEVFLCNAVTGIVPVARIDTIEKAFAKIQTTYLMRAIHHPCSNLLND